MTEQAKRIWLKRVLFVKVLLTLFMWGFPALLGTARFLGLFGLSVPEDPTYLRLFGGGAGRLTTM